MQSTTLILRVGVIAMFCNFAVAATTHAASLAPRTISNGMELKPFGFSFVQIDDKWQDGGNSNGPTRGFDRVAPGGGYPRKPEP